MDGWKRGWVAVTLTGGGVRVDDFPSFPDLLVASADARVIAVDIPIGLPDEVPREADVAARRALAPHGSRVFMTFPREIIAAPTYAAALAACGDGPKPSRQAYGLRAKILEVDGHRADARIHEVHPELSFAAMGGGSIVSKHTWDGVMARRGLLAEHGIELPDAVGAAGRVPVADVLDAAAAAWTAGRIAAGVALCLPADPPALDGRSVAIWL